MPGSPLRRLAESSRLASRLLRQEVRALGVLSNGALVASSREWVYYSVPGETMMRPARLDEAGQKLYPPLTMTVGPNDRILWGEYNSSPHHGNPVRIFVSDDGGKSYEVARVFAPNDIKHLHNLVFDPALRKYWVLVGDWDAEPGLGLWSEDLTDFTWVARGAQTYRTVDVFDLGDRLVYGMDSDLEPNAIVSMDKKTGRAARIFEMEGSCIYSCRCGPWYVVTSTVEQYTVNKSPFANVYVSRDGENWRCVYRAKKDRWSGTYFQYGSIVLPRGESPRDVLAFSGQALQGIDGRVFTADFSRLADSACLFA